MLYVKMRILHKIHFVFLRTKPLFVANGLIHRKLAFVRKLGSIDWQAQNTTLQCDPIDCYNFFLYSVKFSAD